MDYPAVIARMKNAGFALNLHPQDPCQLVIGNYQGLNDSQKTFIERHKAALIETLGGVKLWDWEQDQGLKGARWGAHIHGKAQVLDWRTPNNQDFCYQDVKGVLRQLWRDYPVTQVFVIERRNRA